MDSGERVVTCRSPPTSRRCTEVSRSIGFPVSGARLRRELSRAFRRSAFMNLSLRQILLVAAVVIFVLDAVKAWRLGINPLPLGLALAFGAFLV
ncbi:MAG: hypothetical protein H6R24_2706 [Proteobacteria bacterium]|jgi:hypothetical protein|nr:hypothetical protein [Pseudomonadota bacterium]